MAIKDSLNKIFYSLPVLFIYGFLAGIIVFICYSLVYPFSSPKKTKISLIDPVVEKYSPPHTTGTNLHFKNLLNNYPKSSSGVTFQVPIIMYHYIEVNKDVNDTLRTSLSVTPYYFEKQLITLKENGYTFINFRDLTKILHGSLKKPKKPIILTFDDGYRDFYTDAYPLLKKHGVPATNYLIYNHLDRFGNLTKEMVKEILKSGLITFGSHTLNHVNLVSASEEVAWMEVVESKKKLENEFGIPVNDFSYPYGYFNDKIIEMIKRAGYETSTATTLGRVQSLSNIYKLNRIRVGNYFGKVFLDRIEMTVK